MQASSKHTLQFMVACLQSPGIRLFFFNALKTCGHQYLHANFFLNLLCMLSNSLHISCSARDAFLRPKLGKAFAKPLIICDLIGDHICDHKGFHLHLFSFFSWFYICNKCNQFFLSASLQGMRSVLTLQLKKNYCCTSCPVTQHPET